MSKIKWYFDNHWPARHWWPVFYFGWSEGRRIYRAGIYWRGWALSVSYDAESQDSFFWSSRK